MKTFTNGDELLNLLEALSNPHRMRIIAILAHEQQYVSQLARELQMSRPLLYLHLQKLEEAHVVSSHVEVLANGKSAKYYTLNAFELLLNAEMIQKSIPTLTKKLKKEDA